MAVGVASANFDPARYLRARTAASSTNAHDAAISAGHTRIRPVLMTAAAMIVGMLPMALGGPGGEENAALARAVIGGLLFATRTTLLIVPYLFALLRKGNDGKPVHGVFAEGIELERRSSPARDRGWSAGRSRSRGRHWRRNTRPIR